MIFSPFTIKTLIFVVVSVVVFAILPFLTPRFFKKYGGRVSELEAKDLLFLLFAMGGLAVWWGSEAVLPAYIIGMVLAGTVGKDHTLIRRLRTVRDRARWQMIGSTPCTRMSRLLARVALPWAL